MKKVIFLILICLYANAGIFGGGGGDSSSSSTGESNSTDQFAVRPWKFEINVTTPQPIKAGDEFNVTIDAVDINGSNAKDYNETINIKGTSPDLNYSSLKCLTGDLNMTDGNLTFQDGEANLTLKYTEVGDLNLSLQEFNDSTTFAYVDRNDSNETLDMLLIDGNYTIINNFIPHHFEVNATLKNYDLDGNFTYLDRDFNLYSKVELNITAQNENNETTKNYNTECYAKNIDINVSKVLNPSPEGNLTQLIYAYKDINGNESTINSQNIDDNISINYSESNFTTDDNGSTNITFLINFDRNSSKVVNPFEFNVSSVKINDGNTSETNLDVNTSSIFYYGNLFLFDLKASKDNFTTRDNYFVVYDNNSSDDKKPTDTQLVYDWYFNNYHQSKDGNITNNNIIVSSDYNSSNEIGDVNVTIHSIANGKISFDVNRTSSSRYFAVAHLLESNLKWLWYSRYGNEYNISNGSTCLNHFCFAISWKNSQNSNSSTVKSGNTSGTETNTTDSNNTISGVKIFR